MTKAQLLQFLAPYPDNTLIDLSVSIKVLEHTVDYQEGDRRDYALRLGDDYSFDADVTAITLDTVPIILGDAQRTQLPLNFDGDT